MENTNKVAEVIENALKENKNLLIQALPGSSKNYLTKKSAEKVGLILAEFEDTKVPSLGIPSSNVKNVNSSIITEDAIISSLKDKNATAILLNTILLNTMSGNNIDFYINVAKKTSMPLIVLNTTHDRDFVEIDVKAFDNVEDMKAVFPKVKKFESTALKTRVMSFRLNPDDISVMDSPKLK